MADWTRSMLLFKTTKRFLIQVKRHELKLYSELDNDLRKSYDSQGDWIYREITTRNVCYGDHVCSNKEQIAWDMLRLIEKFEQHEKLSNMNSFKDMARVFGEQCEINDGKVKIRNKPGGSAMVNPSDPDASIDNKGVGYQVQVSETYNPENPVQIITAALPQTASEADQTSLEPMLDEMAKVDAIPESLLADSGYGSDGNVFRSAERNVELIAPTTGKDKKKVGLEECTLDDQQRVITCPCGKKPMLKRYIGEKGRAVFPASTCQKCPLLKRCSASKQGQNYTIIYDARSLRLRERRLHEKTEEFQDDYRPRGGIEALFGRLKQFTPLRRLGVRGKSAVFNAMNSIMAVHNIMQMTEFYKIQDAKRQKSSIIMTKTSHSTSLVYQLCRLIHLEISMAA